MRNTSISFLICEQTKQGLNTASGRKVTPEAGNQAAEGEQTGTP